MATGPPVSYETVDASVMASVGLVIIGDEAIEEADAKGGGALRHSGRVFLRPGNPGDVEMRPGHVVDKALHELSADDAAGGAVAGDVLDVGGVALDRAVVAFGQRQTPDRLADRLAGGDQTLSELVIVGEEAGILVAERDDDGAGQGREIDHRFRLEAVLAIPEHIGE